MWPHEPKDNAISWDFIAGILESLPSLVKRGFLFNFIEKIFHLNIVAKYYFIQIVRLVKSSMDRLSVDGHSAKIFTRSIQKKCDKETGLMSHKKIFIPTKKESLIESFSVNEDEESLPRSNHFRQQEIRVLRKDSFCQSNEKLEENEVGNTIKLRRQISVKKEVSERQHLQNSCLSFPRY